MSSVNNVDRSYIHPLDKQIREKILNSPIVKNLMKNIFEEGLDKVHEYVVSVSYAKVPENQTVYHYLTEGCNYFGIKYVNDIYVKRSYFYDIECVGYNKPSVLIPDCLLKDADESILRARMLSAAGSIAAEHHQMAFLNWILDNISSLGAKYFLDIVTDRLIGEWNRARKYTSDRAVAAATKDLSLAKKNILFGCMPDEAFAALNFEVGNDSFLEQVKAFYQKKGITDISSTLYGRLQMEAWLPERYREVTNYYSKHFGGSLDVY